MDSSVNCVVRADSTGQQWVNAYWNGRQMVYGQVLRDGQLLTLAAALDIVGHEMFHGVTDSTSRLDYSGQSGVLNESYSDIFGVLIANWIEPDTKNWKWTIGDGFGRGGDPFRNFADPTKRNQPDHMRDLRVSPNTYDGDWGGVHTNSGIHNKACYLMLSAEDSRGMVFTPAEVAAIFYLALTQQLSRTSQFAASRCGALSAARSLFRNEPQDARDGGYRIGIPSASGTDPIKPPSPLRPRWLCNPYSALANQCTERERRNSGLGVWCKICPIGHL